MLSIKMRSTFDKSKYLYIDNRNMLQSILFLPEQMLAVFEDKQLDFKNYSFPIFSNCIIVGMGSSLIAYRILESLFKENFILPVLIINSYHLPRWVGKTTLVILSSYSGNSLETVSCVKEALKKGAFIIGITSGGKLSDLLQKNKCLVYKINSGLFNPCEQPRLAIGYSFAAFFILLQKTKVLKTRSSLLRPISVLNKYSSSISLHLSAKKIAQKICNKRMDIISAGFLSGNAELFSRQLQWNSKLDATFIIIPEAMHHLSESIKFPENQSRQRLFLFLESKYFQKEDLKRCSILKRYFQEQSFTVITLTAPGESVFSDALYMILFTSLISFYVAMIHKMDPTPTPGIEYYKNNL